MWTNLRWFSKQAAFTGIAAIAMLPLSAQNAAAPSENQSPDATLQVFTRLVVVDVVVVDKHGIPVLDLTKDDFSVYEGKDEQQIRSVELPSAHRLPAVDVVHSSADLGKIGSAPVNILVLDELNTPFEDNAFTRFAAGKYLKSQPAIMAPTTLLVTNDRSFSMLQDYTQNRDVLEAALKRDPAEYPWRLARNGNNGPEAVVRFGQTLAVLQQIAQAAAGTPGRKNIIWVGRGFPSIDVSGLDDTASKPVNDAIRRCTDLLMTSRVTLYVVDPTPLSSATYDNSSGLASPADLKDETGLEPFSNSVSFNPLAVATGGRVFDSRNDVNNEIAEGIRDGMNYYTIAYRPGVAPDPEDAYRHIHVFVKRPGLTAMTRGGYYVQPPPGATLVAADPNAAAAESRGEVLDVASAALSKMVYNGVKLRAGIGSAGVINLAVADASLTWKAADDGSSTSSIAIVAVCFNAKGKVISHTTRNKVLASAQPNAKAGSEEIVPFPIAFPAGAARVRLVVRDAGSKRLGSADLLTH